MYGVLRGNQMDKVQIDWWHDRRYLGAYRKRKSTPEVCQVIASLFGILAKSYGRIDPSGKGHKILDYDT